MSVKVPHKSLLAPGLLFVSVAALSACGGGSGSTSSSDASFDARANVVQGPLDPVQDQLVTAVLGETLGGTLPAPLGPTVSCLADAVNSLVDGPDAILAALTQLSPGAAPAAALQGASGEFVGAMERFAAELQSALMVLAGQGDTCSTASSGGTPDPFAGNPLAGTPLEPVGSALEDLFGGLGGFAGPEEDPNLTSVTSTLAPLLAQLSGAFDQIPAEAREAPVVGGVFTTLEVALADLSSTLPALGNYNAAGTQTGVEGLLNNLLSNVLLRVVPVEQIDEQTGQDFSGQIQAGIDTATAALGNGVGQLITPLFNDLLDGALSPALDPVEGLLAQILNQLPSGGDNPLDGLLGPLAGNGTGTPLDALLAVLTTGAGGNPLEDLTALLGGNTAASPLDQLTALLGGGGLPLDALLGQLSGLTGQLPIVGDILDGLLGNLPG